MPCDRKPIGRIRASNAIRLLSLMLPIEIKSGTNSRSVKRRAVITLRILLGFAPFRASAADDRPQDGPAPAVALPRWRIIDTYTILKLPQCRRLLAI